jgi:upstream-binding transcription factor
MEKEKKQEPKDTTKPKTPTSAYQYFVDHVRVNGLLQEPVVDSHLSNKAARNLQWKTMTLAQQQPFEELAKRDKQRYEQEVARWKVANHLKSALS